MKNKNTPINLSTPTKLRNNFRTYPFAEYGLGYKNKDFTLSLIQYEVYRIEELNFEGHIDTCIDKMKMHYGTYCEKKFMTKKERRLFKEAQNKK